MFINFPRPGLDNIPWTFLINGLTTLFLQFTMYIELAANLK